MDKIAFSKCLIVDVNTSGGYTFEQIIKNKNCSKNPKYWKLIRNSINSTNRRFLFQSNCAESWEFFDHLIENPIRNTNQIYLKFKDTSKFVEPSNYFRVHKCFTHNIEGTIAGEAYWDDLENKIVNGFEIDGVRITGRHFFTINFGRFRAIPVDEHGVALSTNKIWTFLRFIDHQYYVFHELEECLLEGKFKNLKNYLEWFPNKTKEDFENLKMTSFVGAKSRRKGWSAIEGAGLVAYNFVHKESSMNLIAAYEKEHYKPLLAAVRATKSFTDQYTPWIRVTDIKGTATHFIAGIKTVDDYGVPIEEGYLSEVNALSFQDNPFKAVGNSSDLIIVEEPGKFNSLLETYPVSIEPLIRDGETMIGISVIAGTAGDLDGGGSIALSKMIYNPRGYGFKEYDNIYEDKHYSTKSGWFIDDLWYSPFKISKTSLIEMSGKDERCMSLLTNFKDNYIDTVDDNGNSYRYFSDIILTNKRREKKSTDIKSYNKLLTQQPKYLSEAFLLNENSPFDTATAQLVLADLMINKHKLPLEKGSFALTENGIQWVLNLSLQEIDRYPFDTSENNTDGCWVIYERPVKNGTNSLGWRYLGGVDPIDMGKDESAVSSNHSLAATYIIDTLTRNIVAEYVGRPSTASQYYEQLWRGIEYYGARLLYENNLKGLKAYFEKKSKLYLLADEPESLRDKSGYKMNKNTTKGFHATATINAYARKLVDSWTTELVVQGQDNEENNVYIPRMWYIRSVGLLQELIAWKSSGNFDRVSGLSAAMILLFDRLYEYDEENNKVADITEGGIFEKLRKKLKNYNSFNIKDYGTTN